MFEMIIFTTGITFILMIVSTIYYWRGFNRATQSYSELLHKYEPEAFKRLQNKLQTIEE